MIPLTSALEQREDAFTHWNDYLGRYEFTLGGNWEYDHGYFDRSLDKERKVWLRIPFRVTHGAFDGENDDSDAVIRLGRPFVLKHLYNEGLDGEAAAKLYGSLLDQFQEPVNQDAGIEARWLDKAKQLLRQVEQGLSR